MKLTNEGKATAMQPGSMLKRTAGRQLTSPARECAGLQAEKEGCMQPSPVLKRAIDEAEAWYRRTDMSPVS